jgi:glycosyltransferase involved in cell wall biosynthesis
MKVTCICPTANRPHLLVKCIHCFLAQDYPDKELIILDDGKERFEYRWHLPRNIRYIYKGPQRRSIGAKLNALVDESTADIICRIDDDDWSAPTRISEQVAVLEDNTAFTGYYSYLLYDERYDAVYRYYQSPRYASGSSFMFRASVWCEEKFDELCVTGSDNRFVETHQLKLKATDGCNKLVARLHKQGSNIEVKTPEYFASRWQYKLMTIADVPAEFWANQLVTVV